jgi:hypothetical protein
MPLSSPTRHYVSRSELPRPQCWEPGRRLPKRSRSKRLLWNGDLDDPDLRVPDATAHLSGPESGSTVGRSLRPGLDDYLAAHIPGAAFADIVKDLSQPDGGALSKPSPARFAVAAGGASARSVGLSSTRSTLLRRRGDDTGEATTDPVRLPLGCGNRKPLCVNCFNEYYST